MVVNVIIIFIIKDHSVSNVIKNGFKKMFEISRILVNQGWRRYISTNFLMNLWALITVIFISCFSYGILSSLLIRNTKAINTFEELMSSKMQIICFNNSFIFWNIRYSNAGMYKRIRDSNRIICMDVEESSNVKTLNMLTQLKAVIICDLLTAQMRQIGHMHRNLAIADEMFDPNRVGFLINRRSLVKDKLYKM